MKWKFFHRRPKPEVILVDSLPVEIDEQRRLHSWLWPARIRFVNTGVTERLFPLANSNRLRSVDICIVDFQRRLRIRSILRWFRKYGYEGGRLEHILALAAADLKYSFARPIIPLNSMCLVDDPLKGHIPYIVDSLSGRMLKNESSAVLQGSNPLFIGVKKTDVF